MARKRREGITSYPRYRGKMYSVAYGIFNGNAELALEYANALASARASGFGVYKEAYRVAIPVLQRNEVPSALWGLYRSFIMELINKVQGRRLATVDEIIDKWVDLGLDGGILREVANAVVTIETKETPTPVEKGA
jgi:hypothetical protein